MASGKKQLYAVRLDRDLLTGMKRLKRQVGIPESEQIRRALRKWLTKNGGLRRSDAHRRVRQKQ